MKSMITVGVTAAVLAVMLLVSGFLTQTPAQAQQQAAPLEQSVFLLISTHFTATLGIPLSSPALKKFSFSCSSSVEPRDFKTNLVSRLRTLYTQ